ACGDKYGSFNYEKYATRAETSKLLINMIDPSMRVQPKLGNDVITFEDPMFELLVRGSMNKPAGAILKKDAQLVTSIDTNLLCVNFSEKYENEFRNKGGVRSLNGIQYFKNLTDLRIDEKGKLSDISVVKVLVNLRRIEISYNDIQDISSLKSLVKLEDIT